MLKRILAHLRANPSAKAGTIAFRLEEEKKAVNQVLYERHDLFQHDVDHRWTVLPEAELKIDLGNHRWLTATHFEQSLRSHGSPLETSNPIVTFVVAKNCKILLEALARLLALCNQLGEAGRLVSLDFTASSQTLGYLNRIGFFDHLHADVSVLPARPKTSSAVAYEGNNSGIVELRSIDPENPNTNIPGLLRSSFVACAGEEYSAGAFTIVSELFGNVQEHSMTRTPGFAGLQSYARGYHLQTVISDSGLGIVGTLMPVVEEKYPLIAQRISKASNAEIALLEAIFSEGGLSQVAEDGRGLGLKRSGDFAQKFQGVISVRQEKFEFKIHHGVKGIHFSHSLDLARIAGTHICFDLRLTSQ